jgi:TonB family protein
VWLALGVVVLSHSLSRAQDQSGAERKVLTKATPVYPDIARRLQLSGTVKIEVVVGIDGQVKSTHVTGGSPLLAKAASDAIGKWRWAPAPAETKEVIELHFHPQ